MNDNHGFVELKRGQHCAICGHDQRCKASPSGAILCFRSTEAQVPGFRFLRHVRGCSTYVPNEHSSGLRPLVRRTKPAIAELIPSDLAARATRYVAQLIDTLAETFANELGVSPESLRAVEAGFDGYRLCFFERDASYKVTAINVRLLDGSKRVGSGQKRGLIVPKHLAELPDPVLIVEGPSDVCACLTMGLTAVGRPNNAGGAELLVELLRGRDVLLVGENDLKPDGLWPGRDGAALVAMTLARAWRRGVWWALPSDSKDIRDFLQGNPGAERTILGKQLLAALRENSCIAHPNPALLRRILARKAVRCG